MSPPCRDDNLEFVHRFWSKVDRRSTDECWPWLASQNGMGYGQFRVGSLRDGSRRLVLAHRTAYELLVGPIPEGLTLDHLCRNPQCVNPAHLEHVTNAENIHRGEGGLFNARKTHCQQGHPYGGDNLYVTPETLIRVCRECRSETLRLSRARARAA